MEDFVKAALGFQISLKHQAVLALSGDYIRDATKEEVRMWSLLCEPHSSWENFGMEDLYERG